MRGQLLLGEKRWKERRDLARPDETSSVAHCFVSWVFLSFSLQNFRSVSPSESPCPPLQAAREKRRRHPAPPRTPLLWPGSPPQPPPPGPNPWAPPVPSPSASRQPPGTGGAGPPGPRSSRLADPGGLCRVQGAPALGRGCSSVPLEAHLEGSFLLTRPSTWGNWASGWLVGINQEMETSAKDICRAVHGCALAWLGSHLCFPPVTPERSVCFKKFCRWKSNNKQSCNS